MPLHIFSRLLAIAVAVATGACQIIGPATIQHGRANYNDVIQKTSAQQVLENLVRVSQGETPFLSTSPKSILKSSSTPRLLAARAASGASPARARRER
jgi:hypothetical protein